MGDELLRPGDVESKNERREREEVQGKEEEEEKKRNKMNAREPLESSLGLFPGTHESVKLSRQIRQTGFAHVQCALLGKESMCVLCEHWGSSFFFLWWFICYLQLSFAESIGPHFACLCLSPVHAHLGMSSIMGSMLA